MTETEFFRAVRQHKYQLDRLGFSDPDADARDGFSVAGVQFTTTGSLIDGRFLRLEPEDTVALTGLPPNADLVGLAMQLEPSTLRPIGSGIVQTAADDLPVFLPMRSEAGFAGMAVEPDAPHFIAWDMIAIDVWDVTCAYVATSSKRIRSVGRRWSG